MNLGQNKPNLMCLFLQYIFKFEGVISKGKTVETSAAATNCLFDVDDDSTMRLRIPGRSNRRRVVGMSERRVVLVRKVLF